jgi:hypothetical protein
LKIINREFRATEAGIALSVVTGLLVVLGYAALQFVGRSSNAPLVEIRSEPSVTAKSDSKQGKNVEQWPQVLPAQGPDVQDVPHVTQRPLWEPRPLGDLGHDVELDGNSIWPGKSELPVQYERLNGGLPR